MRTHAHTYTHTHVLTRSHMHTHTHAHSHTRAHARTLVFVRTYMLYKQRMRTHACTHTHTQSCVHAGLCACLPACVTSYGCRRRSCRASWMESACAVGPGLSPAKPRTWFLRGSWCCITFSDAVYHTYSSPLLPLSAWKCTMNSACCHGFLICWPSHAVVCVCMHDGPADLLVPWLCQTNLDICLVEAAHRAFIISLHLCGSWWILPRASRVRFSPILLLPSVERGVRCCPS